eukprot:scaffold174709_cov27-Tisochrysis_lutea.AAC.1
MLACTTTASSTEPHGSISPVEGKISYAAPCPRASKAASRLWRTRCAATLTPDTEKKGWESSCLSLSLGAASYATDSAVAPNGSLLLCLLQAPPAEDVRDRAVDATEAASSKPATARARLRSIRSRSRSLARMAAAMDALRLNDLAFGGNEMSSLSAGAA